MGHITPSLGFVPDSVEQVVERLRVQLQNILGITYTSEDAFLDSNIYRLFLGFATELCGLEDTVVQIVDTFVSWIRETNNEIGFTTSGTYSGITQAFLESFRGVSIASGNTDDSIPPGVALVALDNSDENDEVPSPRISPEEKEALGHIFKNYWPVGISTLFSPTKEEHPHRDIVDIEVSTNDHDRHTYRVTMFDPHPLEICIFYTPLSHVMIPNAQDETLKSVFLESFAQSNAIGRDFDPDSYLSTQNVPWLASCSCRWREMGTDAPYSSERYVIPHYYEKFVIARDAQTLFPLISVEVLP